jgi:hypothetical protein
VPAKINTQIKRREFFGFSWESEQVAPEESAVRFRQILHQIVDETMNPDASAAKIRRELAE